ncbi:MAG: hypothetical protein WB421_14025, partial [Terriglobales bacterium]
MKTRQLLLMILFLYFSHSSLWAQACALNVASGAVTLTNTNVTYCSMSVAVGATLYIQGAVTINVTGNVDIEGTVYGLGAGYGSIYVVARGPGAGSPGTGGGGGGGGGHGGFGGGGGSGLTHTGGGGGGSVNDNPSDPLLMGSAGTGGSGGAAFILSAPSGTITLNGTLDMSGTSAILGSDGGGAGGTLSISAQNIVFNGNLNAIGGGGGFGGDGGGGGGGGLILLCSTLNPVSGTGTYSVAGGSGGSGINPIYTGGGSGASGVYTLCTPTPVIPDNEAFFVSKNLLQPSQGAVSIYVATSQYPGAFKLKIYNSAGEYIQTLDDRHLSAPYQNSYSWNGT